jgi:hypothetical protein
MSFATLSGVRVVAGSIAIPLYGMWAGDVTLATADAVSGDVTLVLGNLTLHGHVYRQASFAGARQCRLVAGHGGWRQDVPSRYYAVGATTAMVVGDAATEVGERVSVPNSVSVGSAWTREAGKASKVLRLLASTWHVDAAGVTTLAAWPTRKITSPFTVERQDGGPGIVTVATEDYAAWMPNATFAAPTLAATYTNKGVRYSFTGDGAFRLEVMTS